jgi:uncharacterized MnhB-related membrane protein
MTVLQATALTLVAFAGTAVVLVREPARQVVLVGFMGLALAVLFFTFQAPDVALSQIVVGSAALPALVLLALAKIRRNEREADRSGGDS